MVIMHAFLSLVIAAAPAKSHSFHSISKSEVLKIMKDTNFSSGLALVSGQLVEPPFSTSFEVNENPSFTIADLLGQAPWPMGTGYSRITNSSDYARSGEQGVFVETGNFGATSFNPKIRYSGGEWDPVYTSFPNEDGHQVLKISVWTKLNRVSAGGRDTNMGLLVSDNVGQPLGIIHIGHEGDFVQFQDGSDDNNNLWWTGPNTVDSQVWNKLGINIDIKNHLISFLLNDTVLHTSRHMSDSVRFAGLFSYAWESPRISGHPRILFDDFSIVPAKHCDGDLNLDGLVNDEDLEIFSTAYNLMDCAAPKMDTNCPSDLNGDGHVNDADFVIFANSYNREDCSAE